MPKKPIAKSKKPTKTISEEKDLLKILDTFRVDKGDIKSDIPLSDVETKPKRKIIPLPNYVKVPTNANKEKFVELGKRIEKGELKWAYFTTDNELAYHYYEVLK